MEEAGRGTGQLLNDRENVEAMGVEAGKSTEVEKQQLTGQKTPHVRVRQERRGKVSHGRETQTMGLSFQVDRKK